MKEALNRVKKKILDYYMEMLDGKRKLSMNDFMVFIVNTFEQEQKNNGWIPVSERLPEKEKLETEGDSVNPILVTFLTYYDKKPKVGGLVVYCEDNKWRWYNETKIVDEMEKVVVEVVAWQPLPEAYVE